MRSPAPPAFAIAHQLPRLLDRLGGLREGVTSLGHACCKCIGQRGSSPVKEERRLLWQPGSTEALRASPTSAGLSPPAGSAPGSATAAGAALASGCSLPSAEPEAAAPGSCGSLGLSLCGCLSAVPCFPAGSSFLASADLTTADQGVLSGLGGGAGSTTCAPDYFQFRSCATP